MSSWVPLSWTAERRARASQWRQAGPQRNTRMLLNERPRLIIAFHDHFDTASGGTSDMCMRGLLHRVPAWLVPGPEPRVGRWLKLAEFPQRRKERISRELAAAWDSQPGLFDGEGDSPE